MRVFRKLDSPIPLFFSRPVVLGLGNFDGCHLGHQKLISSVVERAQSLKGMAALFTFETHPQQVLHPDRPIDKLMALSQKLGFFEKAGIDACVLVPFTEEFSHLSARQFAGEILAKRLCVREVLMGFNARFGHAREGGAAQMHVLAQEMGFYFKEIKPVEIEGEVISSSRIRKALREGDLRQAAACLGRSYQIVGGVIKGAGRGHQLGFPTLNLQVLDNMMPPQGVYAAQIRKSIVTLPAVDPWVSDEECIRLSVPQADFPWCNAVLNYGVRPTFEASREQPVVEIHILESDNKWWEQDKQFEVSLSCYLRGERRFEGAQALISQIQLDVNDARCYFEKLGK